MSEQFTRTRLLRMGDAEVNRLAMMWDLTLKTEVERLLEEDEDFAGAFRNVRALEAEQDRRRSKAVARGHATTDAPYPPDLVATHRFVVSGDYFRFEFPVIQFWVDGVSNIDAMVKIYLGNPFVNWVEVATIGKIAPVRHTRPA